MKKGKRFVVLFLASALVASLAVFGCAAPPTEAPPTEAPPVAEEPIEMSVAIWVPPVHHTVPDMLEPWAQELEKRTNGRLKLTLFTGSALGAPADHFDIAVEGAADIAIFNPGFTPGRFPLSEVIELPFLSGPNK